MCGFLRDGHLFEHLSTHLLGYADAEVQQLFLSFQIFIELYEFDVELVLDLSPLLLAYLDLFPLQLLLLGRQKVCLFIS